MMLDEPIIVTDERALFSAKEAELRGRVDDAERREAAAMRQLKALRRLRQGDKDLLYAVTEASIRKDEEIARLKARHRAELERAKIQSAVNSIVCASLGFVAAALVMILVYWKVKGVW